MIQLALIAAIITVIAIVAVSRYSILERGRKVLA